MFGGATAAPAFGGATAAPAFSFTGAGGAAPAAAPAFNFAGGAAAAPTPAAFSLGGAAPTAAAGAGGFSFAGAAPAAPAPLAMFGGAPAAAPANPWGGVQPGAVQQPGFNNQPPGSNSEAIAEIDNLMKAFGDPQSLLRIPGYNPNNPATCSAQADILRKITDSRFKHIFYDKAPGEPQRIPPISESQWRIAKAEAPEGCVPNPIVGFEELNARTVKLNQHTRGLLDQVKKMKGKLTEDEGNLKATMSRINSETDARRAKHQQQAETLVNLMKFIQIQQCHRYPIKQEEIELKNKLEQKKDKYLELREKLDTIGAECMPQEQPAVEVALASDDVQVIFDFLDKQRSGLKHLTDIVKKDRRDIEIIKHLIASGQ